MKLSIIIPVYHEEDNIVRAIDGIRKAVKTSPYEILIVYDAKDDPTYEVVRRHSAKHNLKQVRLVQNSVGSGRGFLNALKTGFVKARGEAVLVMMADLCDDPKDIDKMYGVFIEGADIVCASRYMKGGSQIGSPLLKRSLSRVGGVSLYYLRRMPIHDITNNFKLYRRAVLDHITLGETGGFEVAMEITLKAHRLGYAIVEIPTTWRDREAGEAKFNLRKMLPRYSKLYALAFRPGIKSRKKHTI